MFVDVNSILKWFMYHYQKKPSTISVSNTFVQYSNVSLYDLQELFPFKTGKQVPFHAQFKENNILVYILPQSV
jgi:hypothetical protein